jgi:hypothetical protein
MTTYLSGVYAQQLSTLATHIADDAVWPSPYAGFLYYLCNKYDQQFLAPLINPSPPCVELGRLYEAPILASAGYLFALNHPVVRASSEAWHIGFQRLAGRDPFPIDRQSFVYRPIELLGITLGVKHCPNTTQAEIDWLINVLQSAESRLKSASCWQYLLGMYASRLLGNSWAKRSWDIGQFPVDDLSIVVWLCANTPDLAFEFGVDQLYKQAEESLLTQCAKTEVTIPDPARAAILYSSLDRAVSRSIESEHERNWQIGRDQADALSIVITLCRRFDLCVRQLQRRQRSRNPFTVQDEYDVQDLMHALLKLHFDDVRPEEWTPSYAGNASRVDFLLKREMIVVEVKMTRDSLAQRELADQLIIDKERYRSHSDCRILVCFVYDPEHRCTNPAALENDLSEQIGLFRVEAIVSPA